MADLKARVKKTWMAVTVIYEFNMIKIKYIKNTVTLYYIMHYKSTLMHRNAPYNAFYDHVTNYNHIIIHYLFIVTALESIMH